MKKAKRLSDYVAPAFSVETVKLDIQLHESNTLVVSKLRVKRLDVQAPSLQLDGEGLELLALELDGEDWKKYSQTDAQLVVDDVPDVFDLVVTTQCNPSQNTALEGLYLSNGTFCTQCEAEGFRKITYFMDRPDVLSTYEVTLTADKAKFPQLLANGNKIAYGENTDGSHWVTWQDPFPKPCYLFALVAGDLACVADNFTTRSGRNVAIELYLDKHNATRGGHAVESLKRAMRWDEDTFDLEYDLDVYMVVAVDFFNMGAMENKGLNIFNSKYVLADEASATDDDYFNIESVIAHEYFHNWTGNRVTCRDWFQLSLKEGLTVFRDQLFSETFNASLSTRIKQVKVMREHQFAEDASPMSHPIRPQEVIEMNNFYTVTVYDKGAEVIRMLWTLLGEAGFKKGMKLYFARHDGQAVTCDDFVNAMQDANSVDLTLFKRWYEQSGTPVVSMQRMDEKTLRISQHTPATADQEHKKALLIPLSIEHLSANADVEASGERIVWLDSDSVDISLSTEESDTVILNCGFRAPIKVDVDFSNQELARIMQSASHPFDRWDASQRLFIRSVIRCAEQGGRASDDTAKIFAEFTQQNLSDLELLSEVLAVPSLESIVADLNYVDFDQLVPAYNTVKSSIASACLPALKEVLSQLLPRKNYRYDAENIMQRRCLNSVLRLGAATEISVDTIRDLYAQSDNMTDTLTALQSAQIFNLDVFESLMADFEQRWQKDPLVLDKWFALHATCQRPDILARMQLLMAHKQYSIRNPNRIRAILGSFAFYNTPCLHASDGSGYKFLVDHLLEIDQVNAQVAARIVTPLLSWKKFDGQRQNLIKAQLQRLASNPQISPDVFEKVSKSLAS
ncbi:aminopeptidase N [Alteromonas flava]|uniref:aminopeptidase N n=1 Tax=Alteromonas flava TaxID=2048003 RepID=UPI000C28E877|nr:aminopeptidase N [Alteromonas flava]